MSTQHECISLVSDLSFKLRSRIQFAVVGQSILCLYLLTKCRLWRARRAIPLGFNRRWHWQAKALSWMRDEFLAIVMQFQARMYKTTSNWADDSRTYSPLCHVMSCCWCCCCCWGPWVELCYCWCRKLAGKQSHHSIKCQQTNKLTWSSEHKPFVYFPREKCCCNCNQLVCSSNSMQFETWWAKSAHSSSSPSSVQFCVANIITL